MPNGLTGGGEHAQPDVVLHQRLDKCGAPSWPALQGGGDRARRVWQPVPRVGDEQRVVGGGAAPARDVPRDAQVARGGHRRDHHHAGAGREPHQRVYQPSVSGGACAGAGARWAALPPHLRPQQQRRSNHGDGWGEELGGAPSTRRAAESGAGRRRRAHSGAAPGGRPAASRGDGLQRRHLPLPHRTHDARRPLQAAREPQWRRAGL
mmetsp:Transcript_39214/g.75155  ORF Transcript_39214/g.75155 Transcript_39214/m.75155 type:complete len:207 (+) Transcript_39214:1853-2473(+)